MIGAVPQSAATAILLQRLTRKVTAGHWLLSPATKAPLAADRYLDELLPSGAFPSVEVTSGMSDHIVLSYDGLNRSRRSRPPVRLTLALRASSVDPSGLYYVRARWYDATTGGFMSRDPISDQAESPIPSTPTATPTPIREAAALVTALRLTYRPRGRRLPWSVC